ncbi:hypothetical protein HS088_TW21G00208 [Tripterygium wilfordii]|uniref:DUF641 domain-containing protein n=1 Tax=Tripterygium wilfordii TaxID=458696 RepID=A0A7J7C2B4_TRIWF|nr:protein GRAVITROPIC IN THE LIGHT 1-like [Tripterygium wilfordii]XP_038689392.1 protein GRAVITROPIC IN THE LIGHT 1-like [Tripterygium wilfordii]XP_038689393.1 protein GRAVITROPIC IN THE LIGHT 1-like [Tripterygium wilfordii]KAF5728065.1 hypothetical protein HS088_TW21G00208 [Tripterygium wilfordii]
MDYVKPSAVTPAKSKLARTFAKVLHLRTATGLCPDDGVQKVKLHEKFKEEKNETKNTDSQPQSFDENDEEFQKRLAFEALLARLFASIASVKASYAQLQYAQCPYDSEGIQAADELVVSELKNLSELKQCYVKKLFDPSPESTILLAEIQEQKSVAKTYEIMGKKLESQSKLKDSEITYLQEKLEESNRHNRLLEKRLNQSGQLSMLDNLHQSRLSPSHFVTVLRHATKSIRGFVRLMIDEMKAADWDLDAAATSIQPGVVYWKPDHKCFAFESLVCRKMFDGFHLPNFGLQKEPLAEKKNQKMLFFGRFLELKSVEAKEYVFQKPSSAFAEFCRVKYLQLIHPQIKTSFLGNSSQRSQVKSGQFLDSIIFVSFAKMAKWIYLLHCLSFSFEPEGSIFQVGKGCRFSKVYMEIVADEVFLSPDSTAQQSYPGVAFTIVPGFKIGKIIIQSQVYLAHIQ